VWASSFNQRRRKDEGSVRSDLEEEWMLGGHGKERHLGNITLWVKG